MVGGGETYLELPGDQHRPNQILRLLKQISCMMLVPEESTLGPTAEVASAHFRQNVLRMVRNVGDDRGELTRPISPPVFQKGRNIAWKSPQRFSFNAFMNPSRCRSSVEGRITVKSLENSSYCSRFHFTGSPM